MLDTGPRSSGRERSEKPAAQAMAVLVPPHPAVKLKIDGRAETPNPGIRSSTEPGALRVSVAVQQRRDALTDKRKKSLRASFIPQTLFCMFYSVQLS